MNARQVVLYTVLVISVVLGAYTLYLLRNVLILIFLGVLFATAIAPLVDRMRILIGPGQAVLIIYMAIAGVLAVIGYFIFRVLIEQATTLLSSLPDIIYALGAYVSAIQPPVLRDMLLQLLDELSGAVTGGESPVPGGVTQGIFSVTISLFNIGFAFFTILVIAYYWIVDRPSILRLLASFFPSERRAMAYTIWEDIEARLGGWVRGELILMGMIAGMAAVGYTLLGLKFALVLAVFAGLTELIPILGPWIGSAPAVLVALTQDFWLAVAIAIYAAVIQTLEGNVLVPRIVGKATGINPLAVIIALLVGGTLMGIVGVFLAVPVASAIQVIIQALVLEPRSETRTSAPPPLRP